MLNNKNSSFQFFVFALGVAVFFLADLQVVQADPCTKRGPIVLEDGTVIPKNNTCEGGVSVCRNGDTGYAYCKCPDGTQISPVSPGGSPLPGDSLAEHCDLCNELCASVDSMAPADYDHFFE